MVNTTTEFGKIEKEQSEAEYIMGAVEDFNASIDKIKIDPDVLRKCHVKRLQGGNEQ